MLPLDLWKPANKDGRPGIASLRELLEMFVDEGFVSRTHGEDLTAGSPEGKALLLRHDVDWRFDGALPLARVEADLGLRSTYFFLPPGDYGSLSNYYGTVVDGRIVHSDSFLEGMRELRGLGHEVGIHNDFLQLSVHTGRTPRELLAEEIAWFAEQGIDVLGTASHGSRFAREHGFVNYELFTEAARQGKPPRCVQIEGGEELRLQQFSYTEVGLRYEAYEVPRDCYVSDSGGRFVVLRGAMRQSWDRGAPSPVIMSKVRPLLADRTRAVVLLHPEWWTERVPRTRSSSVSPRRAALPVVTSDPVFRRTDGKPVRIGVRGDCCCRRMVHMNKAMFPDGYDMLVNEKCTNAAYADTLRGRVVSDDELRRLSDVDAMSASLRTYYLGQNDRSVVAMDDMDLLVMDTYSDMNFELWSLPGRGAKVWVHPKMVRRESDLAAGLTPLGRATLEDAVLDAVRVIDAVRKRNPGVPVLFLNQPVEYYSKLEGRRGFYRMGERVALERHGVYYADPLDISSLEPDDMDSSGPGQTLHFTGPTYRRMVVSAWQRGLADHFDGSPTAREEVAAAGRSRPVPLSAIERFKRTPAGRALRVRVRAARRAARSAKRRAARLRARALAPGAPRRAVRKVRRRLGLGAPAAAPPPRATAVVAVPPAPAPEPAATVTAPEPAATVTAPEPVATATIGFGLGSADCLPACAAKVERAHASYREYFTLKEDDQLADKRWTPMLLPVEEVLDYASWEQHIKSFGKGSRLRQKRKAERLGYVVHEFAWAQHVPDIYDINTSKEVRSGGPMRASFRRTIEEMGGAPKAPSAPIAPACVHHWDLRFGAFLPEPGHRQGDVVTDERLVAYVALSRRGDVALYSMILGHGDHLANGVLVLLHHEIVRWVGENQEGPTADLRFLMYGGRENGGASLLQWKRQAGFRPYHVVAVDKSEDDRTADADGSTVDADGSDITERVSDAVPSGGPDPTGRESRLGKRGDVQESPSAAGSKADTAATTDGVPSVGGIEESNSAESGASTALIPRQGGRKSPSGSDGRPPQDEAGGPDTSGDLTGSRESEPTTRP
ncbi:hypothetical protein [Actinoplanes sp. NPDC049599]|uniref:hypothetical protein n=1 Tax=Actinoplanes sp. NPDC049599 TaxID=3363903 RepID=UPI0037AD8ADC